MDYYCYTNSFTNKVIRLLKINNQYLATKVVLLFIRLKIRFFITLLLPYFTNKTTLLANGYGFIYQPYYLIFR